MRAIPITPQIVEVARRILWFEEPERALADPVRFMAYAMTYARHKDMQVIREHVSDEEIREALDTTPPGIIDPRSWAYWNLRMGRFPPPPLRKRTFGESGSVRPTSDLSLEEHRRAAAETWQKIRKDEPSDDMEEMRRRAVREWRNKYGPEKQ